MRPCTAVQAASVDAVFICTFQVELYIHHVSSLLDVTATEPFSYDYGSSTPHPHLHIDYAAFRRSRLDFGSCECYSIRYYHQRPALFDRENKSATWNQIVR